MVVYRIVRRTRPLLSQQPADDNRFAAIGKLDQHGPVSAADALAVAPPYRAAPLFFERAIGEPVTQVFVFHIRSGRSIGTLPSLSAVFACYK